MLQSFAMEEEVEITSWKARRVKKNFLQAGLELELSEEIYL